MKVVPTLPGKLRPLSLNYFMKFFCLKRVLYPLFVSTFLFSHRALSSKQGEENSKLPDHSIVMKEVAQQKEQADFTIVLKKDGTLWGKGKNRHGQLGVGVTSQEYFLPVETSAGPLENVIRISCSDTTTIAYKKDGSIWNSDDEISLDKRTEAQQQSSDKSQPTKKEDTFSQQTTSPLQYQTKVEEILHASGYSDNKINLLSYSDAGKNQPAPDLPFSISIAATGPYRAPANVTLIAHVTHPQGTLIKQVVFYDNEVGFIATLREEPYELSCSIPQSGNYHITAVAYDNLGESTSAVLELNVLPCNRYYRGFDGAGLCYSSMIAMDEETAISLDGIDDFRECFRADQYPSYPWFLRYVSSVPELNNPCYHLDLRFNHLAYTAVNTLPKLENRVTGGQPPFVAFGSQGGGSPLYINEDYHFGIAAGGKNLHFHDDYDLLIEIYDKKSFDHGATLVAPICVRRYSLPSSLDKKDPAHPAQAPFSDLLAHGNTIDYHIVDNSHQIPIDFDTQIEYILSDNLLETWGEDLPYPFLITHRAANSSYYYKISILGAEEVTTDEKGSWEYVSLASQQMKSSLSLEDLKADPHKAHTYNLTYTLDFDDPGSWRTTFLHLPYFQGIPLPSTYLGKSVDELIHQAPQVSDTLLAPKENQYLSLGVSPELKIHPQLDSIVEEKGGDPMALANYVQNEIELTDAIGYNTSDSISALSINPQGMSRDALATYLEGQGSPLEQCALLIYLLRRAGYPAAYVFPENNKTLLFDEQLSKILHTQIRGAINAFVPANLPELIPINYPWVTTYVNGSWIHLFPWMKDTQVKEGKNLWNYFPSEFNTPTKWLFGYVLNNQKIRNPLNTNDAEILSNDNPGTLFPLFAEQELAKNNLSLDDVGISFINQPHYYTDWSDFPRPWQTPLITGDNITEVLDVASLKHNEKLEAYLKDLFDTLEIKIVSNRNGKGASDPNNPVLLETGIMRYVDIHDRRLLLYHHINPDGNYTITLSLEAYNNNQEEEKSHTFFKGSNPDQGDFQSPQKITANLGTHDGSLSYIISSTHHQQAKSKELNYFEQFPIGGECLTNSIERPLEKGDMAALSLNYGRVSERMKEFELAKYTAYQKKIKKNPTLPIDPEIATGQMLHLMGRAYYYYCSQFRQQLERLTKTHTITTRAEGLSKLSPARDSHRNPITVKNSKGEMDFNLVYPRVDMFFHEDVDLWNNTAHNDSGTSFYFESNGEERLFTLESSSQEHRIINEFFNQKGAISTLRLLDIAQGWSETTGIAAHPAANVGLFTKDNYSINGNPVPFLSATKEYGLWDSIESTLKDHLEGVVLCHQGAISYGHYTGMGALTLSSGSSGAIISDSSFVDHGGYGEPLDDPISSNNPPLNDISGDDPAPIVDLNSSMDDDNDGDDIDPTNNTQNDHEYDMTHDPSSPYYEPTPPPQSNNSTPPSSAPNGSPGAEPTPNHPNTQPSASLSLLNTELNNHGYMGSPSYYEKLINFVMDPVNVVTGEFYINALDLKLNGPMPLEVRRLYGSKNIAGNNLGGGWKLNFFHYLLLSVDGNETTPPALIYAAEEDGSVIAYRYKANEKTWRPTLSDNPNLMNPNDGSTLESHNLFNNFITKKEENTYLLQSSHGTLRTFKVRSFPSLESPEINRTRPYLDSWSDTNGNGYHFSYGADPKRSDYGELINITSNNGNSLYFHYGALGNITEVTSKDGRTIKYAYDSLGDLTQVTLADNSVINYSYQHAKNADGKFYSTHLLTQEKTPNGRIIENSYDEQRRVISQASTVGTNPKPTLSASFTYSVSSSNADNTINGTTSVKNALGSTTTYSILNSQISKIHDPGNRTIVQNWNPLLRCLTSRIDSRGLISSFEYDTQGNLISQTFNGNITGYSSSENAKSSFIYNANNMLTSLSDPMGNTTSYAYTDSSHPLQPTAITRRAEGKTISSTQFNYGNFGLPASVNVDGFTTSYSYNQYGFLTSMTQNSGTDDPNITTTMNTNARGEIVFQLDAEGILKKYSYDAFGHPTFEETFDKVGNPLQWHSWYYNWNGELEWEQGTRFNPVDYTYYDYDRAGHLLHQGVWLSGLSEKGVTSVGIAATQYSYDALGNCLSITDPNGNITTMSYDALGNMLTRSLGSGAASESFTYEPGGKIATHKTVLGGIESNIYNSKGQLLSVTQANGRTSTYRYDLSGRLVEEIFSNGTHAQITYDGNTMVRALLDGAGKSLGSISQSYDGRGNLTSKRDLAGNTWNDTYDGLGRLKSEHGPLRGKNYFYKPGCTSWVNEQGEWQNDFIDGIGRSVLTTLFNADGSVAYEESKVYSGDHQSVSKTMGSGINAITTTTTSDLQGRPLIITHPTSCTLFSYLPGGQLLWYRDDNGIQRSFSYNSLNQLETEMLPFTDSSDNAQVHYERNAAGEILKRIMPEGLIEENEYDQAGQKIADALLGSDGSITRHHTYEYQDGLLSNIKDPRGFSTSFTYDAWGHPLTITSNGSKVPEQNQNTCYTYDPRGLLTSVAQSYSDPSTGPSTLVSRTYSAQGDLSSEATSLNGNIISSWEQTWDDSGRRIGLNWKLAAPGEAGRASGPAYHFSYNALGMMTGAQMNNLQAGSQARGSTCSYGYGDHGLLLWKQTPAGNTTLTRDNYGNIIHTKLPDGSVESLSWREGKKIASYSIAGIDNETRNYKYDGRGNLIEEPYTLLESANPSLLAAGTHTAGYSFDNLGIRDSSSISPSGKTLTGSSGYIVKSENSFHQPTLDIDYSSDWYNYPWSMDYDGLGEVTVRHSENFTTQSLSWDSFGRLVRISQRNAKDQGYNWSTSYDGLGRRIETRYADASGNSETSTPLKLRYYYDPEIEFLELGHSYVHESFSSWPSAISPSSRLETIWNLYGPDRSGFYGGAEGIGGLEATYEENGQNLHGVINNYFGDSLAITTDAGLYPWGNVLGGYGAMPGSSLNTDLVAQWRDRYLDWSGFYYLGTRYYEPKSGRFLSPDPLGHAASLNLYDYCHGDPVNGIDPDGRCVESAHSRGYLDETEYQNAGYMIEKAREQSDPSLGMSILRGLGLSLLDQNLGDTSITSSSEAVNYSINGVNMNDAMSKEMSQNVSNHLHVDQVTPIPNPTHGIFFDLIRAAGQNLGITDLTSLRAADTFNASAAGKIHVVSYSNGSSLLLGALPFVHDDVKSRMDVQALGGQVFIDQNRYGLHSSINYRVPSDPIPSFNLSNRNKAYELIEGPAFDWKHPFQAHNFKNYYAPSIRPAF